MSDAEPNVPEVQDGEPPAPPAPPVPDATEAPTPDPAAPPPPPPPADTVPVPDPQPETSIQVNVPGLPNAAPPTLGGAVKVPEDALAPPPATEKHTYWCGTTPDSPIQNITAGGVCFPRWTGRMDMGKDGQLESEPARGALYQLDADQVELVVDRVADAFIRGEGPMAVKMSKTMPYGSKVKAYVPQANDVPLGCFIYMVRMEPTMPVDWRMAEPETMVERV